MSIAHTLRRNVVVLIVAAMLVPLAGLHTAYGQRTVPQDRQQITLSFAPLVKAVSPAVVNIYARRHVKQNVGIFNDPVFRRFFGEDFLRGLPSQERVQNALGSGVIVRASGLVVTNNHVVQGSDEIRVVLADRREFDASVLLTDQKSDLAVLKINGGGVTFPHLDLRDSDDVEVGDLVVAIGNPFGLNQTVTFGIISATARTSLGINDTGFFLQTDAAINPGNSGGALVGMDGKLVGINTAILSRSGGSIGIGFATPSNIVARVVESAESGSKRVVRSWFGATVQSVTPEIAASLALDRPSGVVVKALTAGGPAEKAGLRSSDVIASINGHVVDDERSVKFRMATLPPKGQAELKVLRAGKELTLELPLQPPPETPPRDEHTFADRSPFSGATVANLSPAVAEELGLDTAQRGVIVTAVEDNSIAARFLQPGDRVMSVDDKTVDSVADLRRIVEAGGNRWHLMLKRDGQTVNLNLRG